MTSSAVRVAHVVKRFGSVIAVDDLSFEVEAGELFGLVGPDGAGKTTLFRILTTLLVPDRGSATVLGADVVRDFWTIRSRIGYMPGRFALYADLSVEENLAFFAAVFGTTLDKGRALIAPIYEQIEPFRDRRAGALSGGMKQKLALCCALVHKPELLLLDEPTTGVDAVSRREFWDLLASLRESGLTIIASTPYMDEAARCGRVALMQGGKLLALDAPHRIGARFPRTLFGVSGGPRALLLQALRAYRFTASSYPFGERVHFSDRRTELDSQSLQTELIAYLKEFGVRDAEIVAIDPGIEDAFMELMASPVTAAA
jgi:ABC-2 type transport system ATP-binding protein